MVPIGLGLLVAGARWLVDAAVLGFAVPLTGLTITVGLMRQGHRRRAGVG